MREAGPCLACQACQPTFVNHQPQPLCRCLVLDNLALTVACSAPHPVLSFGWCGHVWEGGRHRSAWRSHGPDYHTSSSLASCREKRFPESFVNGRRGILDFSSPPSLTGRLINAMLIHDSSRPAHDHMTLSGRPLEMHLVSECSGFQVGLDKFCMMVFR